MFRCEILPLRPWDFQFFQTFPYLFSQEPAAGFHRGA